MIKTAIFVEGQTELIFTREMLLRIYNWSNINIECYTLYVDSKHQPTEYPYESPNAGLYFQINNVGNDNALLSRIKKREQWLWAEGFHRIVGLRDMYSKAYRSAVQNAQISPQVNQKFIEGHAQEIQKFSSRPNDIHFQFAIMEVEAWLLGLAPLFAKINPALSTEFIQTQLGAPLDAIDPETTFFHPASVLNGLFMQAGAAYDKSKGDVYSIVNVFEKEDYEALYQKNACASFNPFFDALTKYG